MWPIYIIELMERKILYKYADEQYQRHICPEFDEWYLTTIKGYFDRVEFIPEILTIDSELVDMLLEKEKELARKTILKKWEPVKPSGKYIKVPTDEAHDVAVKALDKAFNSHFISAYIENKDAAFISVDEALFSLAKRKYEARLKHESGIDGDNDEWMEYCRAIYQ